MLPQKRRWDVMDSATANLSCIRVPPDDGSVSQALVDLEARLSAWTEAMLDGQRRLKEMGGSGEKPAVPTLQPPSKEVGPPTSEHESVEKKEEKIEQAAELLVDNSPVVDDMPAKPPPDRGDEEAQVLLASLDEETAEKMHILCRLNPDKDLRELLRECGAGGQGPDEGHPRKRSWFSRGR